MRESHSATVGRSPIGEDEKMSMEERIRFLLRVACRAEGEGNERAARLFRRMADEARPLEAGVSVATLHPAPGGWSE